MFTLLLASLRIHGALGARAVEIDREDLGDDPPRPPAPAPSGIKVLKRDFTVMEKVRRQELLESTVILEAGDERYALYNMTMGDRRCGTLDDFPRWVKGTKALAPGDSDRLVIEAGEGRFVIKGVAPSELLLMVPLAIQRESMHPSLKGSRRAFYHRSLLSPVCWGLAPLSRPNTVWVVMLNLAVPPADNLDQFCRSRGGSSFMKMFDIKGKTNGGRVRSGFWQYCFGKREDWEYGFERNYPGGLTFVSENQLGLVLDTLDTDIKALTAKDQVDYSLQVVTYGCQGTLNRPLTTIPRLSQNVHDSQVRTKDGLLLRVSPFLNDFARQYSELPALERWMGAKGWCSEDYGERLYSYVRTAFNAAPLGSCSPPVLFLLVTISMIRQ